MELSKLIYEVREQLGAISDDRYVDERYIINTINTFRADFLRKLIARKPYYNTLGFQQNIPEELTHVSKSVFPGIELGCKILRTINSIQPLIYEGENNSWFSVSTADISYDGIELVSLARARNLTFEFNSVYAFLGLGKDDVAIKDKYYLYIIAKDNLELEQVVLSGLFEDPLAVDPGLTNYPIKASDWGAIRGPVVEYIRNKPQDDPINNSETDLGNGKARSSSSKASGEEEVRS